MVAWIRAGFDDPRECTKCHETRPADEFYIREQGVRRRRECKRCWTLASTARYPGGAGAPAEAKKIWRERNRDKSRAHRAVAYALQTGRLVRQSCEAEGCEIIKTHAHHDDYSERLVVRWLCPRHHKLHHKLEAVC